MMDSRKQVDRLNDLIALDHDAVGAYQAAIDRMHVETTKTRLREFQEDHRRHIRDLTAIVTRLGGKARTSPDVKGFVLKGFTAITSMMGDEQALQAMRGNEQLTNRTYRKALEEQWPEDIRAAVEKNYNDEQRHLEYIESAIRNRLWESGEARV